MSEKIPQRITIIGQGGTVHSEIPFDNAMRNWHDAALWWIAKWFIMRPATPRQINRTAIGYEPMVSMDYRWKRG
jgi:hypothetical protein